MRTKTITISLLDRVRFMLEDSKSLLSCEFAKDQVQDIADDLLRVGRELGEIQKKIAELEERV